MRIRTEQTEKKRYKNWLDERETKSFVAKIENKYTEKKHSILVPFEKKTQFHLKR